MNAIQISGGVDSMAMLHHLRHLWDDSVVMWCDTGAAYAETRALMERVKKLVPRFRVVHGNQPEVIARAGFPVDVVPVRHSLQGELAYGPQVLKYQSYIDCCRQSIWSRCSAPVSPWASIRSIAGSAAAMRAVRRLRPVTSTRGA
jgi:hypothetical protein